MLAAHGTARVRFQIRTLDEDDGEWFELYDRPEGRIEFAGLRFEITGQGAGEGGRRFWRNLGEDQWNVEGAPEGSLGAVSPFWLIELVRGAVRAEQLDAGGAGDGLTGYSCTFDVVAAADASEHRLGVPGSLAVDEWRSLAGEVWLDPDGCLRRASCRMPWTEIDLALEDLGGPGPVELPSGAKPFT